MNGVPATAFVDLGSECSLISKRLIDKLPVTPRVTLLEEPVSLSLVNNELIPVEEQCTVHVTIDGIRHSLTYFIVNQCTSSTDIIIGQNFTEGPEIAYCIKNGMISFQQRNEEYAVGIISHMDSERLKKLLSESKSASGTIGKTNTVKLHIRLTSGIPITSRPYRIPEADRALVRDIIQDLLEKKIICESSSPYCSPVLLTDKKNRQ